MRNFKTIMNSLVKDGFTERKTSVLFEGEPLLQFTRDLFMFSFYTRGMAFVDIAFLRQEDLQGNTLSYSRRKTGQHLQISINEPIQILISRYSSVSQYLFPIVFSEDSEAAYREYRNSLRRINNALKTIGTRLNLTIPLTTYVARHSWATQARQKGYPVAVISEGLGHSSENITQIYLKEFDQSVLDMANDEITSCNKITYYCYFGRGISVISMIA